MKALTNPEAFFAWIRGAALFGATLAEDGPRERGVRRLLDAFGKAEWPLAWTAYGLATDFHETAHSMQPVKERGTHAYLARYDTGRLAKALGNTPEADGDGERYCGRGDAQVTGLDLYRRFDQLLGLGGRLVANPDLALEPDISAAIITIGMQRGIFTGRKLVDYLPRTGTATFDAFVRARAIVNGRDRGDLIAGFAEEFQDGLQAGGWSDLGV